MRRRVKRRLAVLVALGLAACQPPERRLLRVNDAAIGELDPHKASDYADSILMMNVYDFLVRTGPDGRVVPDLATGWTVAEDGRTYTFALRDDPRFHDGTPVEAGDVVFSMERMTQLNRGYSYLLPELESVIAVDPNTVRFTLNAAFAPFVAALTRVAIVNRERVDGQPETFLSSEAAGSGAYEVVSHDPRQLTLLHRSEAHHQPFAPDAPEIVRIKYSMAVPTVRALMGRGQHEITRLSMPPEVLRALARSPGIELAHDRGTSSFFIMLNTRRPPTDDVHFRRALAHAFDYDALLRLLQVDETFANGVPSRGPVPPRLLGHDPEASIPRRDLEAARRALARSRYTPDEHPVEIQWVTEVGNTERASLLFQQNMAEIGVRVEITGAPWALVLDRASRAETTPHANTVDVSAYTPDPDSILTAMYHSDNSGSWSAMAWLQDPAIDARIEAGRAILERAARERHYLELNRDLVALQPAIFGYRTSTVIAKQRFVTAPQLDDPSRAIPTTGGNYVFREYSLGPPP